jgi:ankyrin repeat protein
MLATLIKIIKNYNSYDQIKKEAKLAKFREILIACPELCMAGQFCNKNLMHQAVENGCKEILQIILEIAVNNNSKNEVVNIVDLYDDTPLHLAINKEKREITNLLFQNGADVMAVNKEGKTPLDLAAIIDNKPSTKLDKALVNTQQFSDKICVII